MAGTTEERCSDEECVLRGYGLRHFTLPNGLEETFPIFVGQIKTKQKVRQKINRRSLLLRELTACWAARGLGLGPFQHH